MSEIKTGQAVNLIQDSSIYPEVFNVIICEPDADGDIILLNRFGQYTTVNIDEVEPARSLVKGRFYVTNSNEILFNPDDGSFPTDIKRYLTDIIEVSL
jgi:hypothetical protein